MELCREQLRLKPTSQRAAAAKAAAAKVVKAAAKKTAKRPQAAPMEKDATVADAAEQSAPAA